MASEREDLIRESWERWNAGDRDPDSLLKGISDDIVIESALTGRTYRGRDGLVEWMAEIDESFGAWNLRIDEIRAARPDRYLVLGNVHLEGRGSGLALDQPIGWVVDFDGELTSRLRNFASHEEAKAAAEAS